MNTQRIKLFGLSLVLTVLPMLAASAQVTMNLSDSPAQTPATGNHLGSNFGSTQSANTIALNHFGRVVGQVASIDESSRTATGLSGLDIFFVRNGEIIQQSQTDAEGDFSVAGLTEGPYSFYAAGKNGLAAYGVYVTSQPQANSQNLLEAVTASSSNTAIQQLIGRNAPPRVAESLKSAIQSVTRGTEVQTNKQIRLINGRLYGQISTLFSSEQPIAGVQIQLIQNSETVAQVETDANGGFSVPDVEPGVYAITQLDACLTCPYQAVDQPVDYAVSQDAYLEPSYADTYSAPIEYAGESVSYGGASGGTCGACNSVGSFDAGGVVRGRFGLQGGCNTCGPRLGGRIGGGGLGRLLSIGGLAGAIVAIADDDDPDEVSGIGN